MTIADDILAALAEHTWLTDRELARLLGRDNRTIHSATKRMRAAKPKRIYCAGHMEEDDGHRRYPRPFYALGDLRCRPRPPRPPRDRSKRHRSAGAVRVDLDAPAVPLHLQARDAELLP